VQTFLNVIKPQAEGNTEATLSFEEKMRRERLRDLSVGVTEYEWYVACCRTLACTHTRTNPHGKRKK
jgi:hypothetical protein